MGMLPQLGGVGTGPLGAGLGGCLGAGGLAGGLRTPEGGLTML